MSLDKITKSFEARLNDFAGLNARVIFDLGDDGVIAVDATASPPALSHEAIEADCTIRLSADNMEKLIEGALNPMMAYTLGKLKIDGSMGVAMKVASLLEE
ncbi:MAG: SCP2 sterol-binding domain-containing protein [Kiloniellales bacterium]|jgi:putative sterol carrier protein